MYTHLFKNEESTFLFVCAFGLKKLGVLKFEIQSYEFEILISDIECGYFVIKISCFCTCCSKCIQMIYH